MLHLWINIYTVLGQTVNILYCFSLHDCDILRARAQYTLTLDTQLLVRSHLSHS